MRIPGIGKAEMYIFAVLALVLLLGQEPSTNQPECKKLLGPVCLQGESSALLEEVEKLHGKRVQLQNTTKHDVGNSRTEPDGTPILQLNPSIYSKSELRQEAAVVHELFHLKMKANGYPFVGFEPTALYEANAAFFDEMNLLVFSTIEHMIFYPQMRKMGLDPSTEFEEYFLQLDQRGDGPTPPNDRQRAVFFMKAALEFTDRKLVEKLEQWYETHQWSKALAAGKDLAKTVTNSQLSSPDDEIHIFVRCMNILVGDMAKFSLVKWEERYYGSVVARVGVVRVVPATDR